MTEKVDKHKEHLQRHTNSKKRVRGPQTGKMYTEQKTMQTSSYLYVISAV